RRCSSSSSRPAPSTHTPRHGSPSGWRPTAVDAPPSSSPPPRSSWSTPTRSSSSTAARSGPGAGTGTGSPGPGRGSRGRWRTTTSSADPWPPRRWAGMQMPVADNRRVRAFAARLLRSCRRALLAVVALQALAAVGAFALPWLLGGLVDAVLAGTTREYVDTVAGRLVAVVVLQALVTRYAQRGAMVLGEEVFAVLRERFLLVATHVHPTHVVSACTVHITDPSDY